MGRKKKDTRCPYCNTETTLVIRPVWSSEIKKHFCEFECLQKYERDYIDKPRLSDCSSVYCKAT